jgi:hypothetical protein
MFKKSLAISTSLDNKTMIRKVRSQIEGLKKSKKDK